MSTPNLLFAIHPSIPPPLLPPFVGYLTHSWHTFALTHSFKADAPVTWRYCLRWTVELEVRRAHFERAKNSVISHNSRRQQLNSHIGVLLSKLQNSPRPQRYVSLFELTLEDSSSIAGNRESQLYCARWLCMDDANIMEVIWNYSSICKSDSITITFDIFFKADVIMVTWFVGIEGFQTENWTFACRPICDFLGGNNSHFQQEHSPVHT